MMCVTPFYFQKSLQDKKNDVCDPVPGNKLPGYFQMSLRDIEVGFQSRKGAGAGNIP